MGPRQKKSAEGTWDKNVTSKNSNHKPSKMLGKKTPSWKRTVRLSDSDDSSSESLESIAMSRRQKKSAEGTWDKNLTTKNSNYKQSKRLGKQTPSWNSTVLLSDSDDSSSESLVSYLRSWQSSENEADSDDDVGLLYGVIRGDIVGVRYYKGMVNNGEMVSLVREPENLYDPNAVKVNNVIGQQVGHIQKKLAKALANIMDRKLARVEGVVPYGSTQTYSMPIDLTFWGQMENRKTVTQLLKKSGFDMLEGVAEFPNFSSGQARITTASELYKKGLDELFESFDEGDKTSERDPCNAIVTPLFTHQKQALNWMMEAENGNILPPFWNEKVPSEFYNSITNSTTKQRPNSIRGGILADDMGLGKSLEIISLIVTNFENGQPLVVPVPGQIRPSKLAKMERRKDSHRLAKKGPCSKDDGVDEKQVAFGSSSIQINQASGASLSEDIKPVVKKRLISPKSFTSTESRIERDNSLASFQAKDVYAVMNDITSPVTKDLEFTKLPEAPQEFSSGCDLSSNNVALVPNHSFVLSQVEDMMGFDACASMGIATDCYLPSLSDCDSEKNNAVEKRTVEESSSLLNDWGRLRSKVRKTARHSDSSDTDENLRLPAKKRKNDTGDDDLPDLDIVQMPESKCASYSKQQCQKSTGQYEINTKRQGPRATLIVCPLSTLSNWLDQIEEHVDESVTLKVFTYYGSTRSHDFNLLAEQDIVLTTYHTLAADSKGKNILQKVHWLRIVLDEGHMIRNPGAQMTKAALLLKSDRKWVVTGTPVQNSSRDLWSLVRFLNIEPFHVKQWWDRTIGRLLEAGNPDAMRRVQCLLGRISLRRVKGQIVNGKPIVDLPTRDVKVETLQLSDEERKLYDAMQNEGKFIVSRYCKQGTLLNHYGEVMAIMMRLRQMCLHPFLVAKAAAAVQKMMESVPVDDFKKTLIEKILMVLSSGSEEDCSICLEALNSPVITHCAHVYCRPCIEAVIKAEKLNSRCPMCRAEITKDTLVEVPPDYNATESIPSEDDQQWQTSSKVEALMQALIQLREEDPTIKSLVVSQFTSFLSLVETPLRESGFQFVRLDGTLSNKQRRTVIKQFSNCNQGSPSILLLSLTAGGVGLNLTSASRVFLLDPAWNPASEEQCFDRCHRLGQTRPVIITKYVVENSIEEKMLDLQEKKRRLAQGIFQDKKQTVEEKRQSRINDIKNLMDL